MDFLRHILLATWQVLVLMAPYLLLGFAVAGVVSALLSPDWVRRHMGGHGLWQVVKAALAAVPALGERCAACASQGWGGAAAVVLLLLLAPGLWKKT